MGLGRFGAFLNSAGIFLLRVMLGSFMLFGHGYPKLTKYLMTPEVVEKERRYLTENPHERELREIFRLARIDYGRIDYAMLGDRLQVWEINTNPSITSVATLPDDTERDHVLRMRAEQIAAAFVSIDTPDDANDAIVKDVSNRLDH